MHKLLVLPLAVLCLSVTVRTAGAVDASNSTVTCNTITKGQIKPKPSLVNGGTEPSTVKIKGKLSGCTTNAPGVTSITGSFKGELTGGTNDCAGLVGLTTNVGTIDLKWKATPALDDNTSTVTLVAGSAVGLVVGPFGSGLYGAFGLGNPPGLALSVTGSFTGGNGGATSVATVITTQDIGEIATECASTKGVKVLNIGLGSITLQ
jgi:hypothetical protein